VKKERRRYLHVHLIRLHSHRGINNHLLILVVINIITMSSTTHHYHHHDGDDGDGVAAADADVMCGMCANVLVDAVVTPCCRHRFCRCCIDQLLASSSCLGAATAACPMCRRRLSGRECTSENDAAFLSKLAATPVACRNIDAGCRWTGRHAELSAHQQSSCMHQRCINHSLGCIAIGSSDDMMMHAMQCRYLAASAADQAAGLIDTNNDASSSASDASQRHRFKAQIEAMLASKIVVVDVGGRVIKSTEHTLRRERGSLLDELLSGHYSLPTIDVMSMTHVDDRIDADTTSTNNNSHHHRLVGKHVFLDCDPDAFANALHWLRTYV
jgi:hypothetical protein